MKHHPHRPVTIGTRDLGHHWAAYRLVTRPAGGPVGQSQGLVDDVVDLAAGRRRVRQALGMPSGRRISDEVIDGLLAGASTEEEIAGPGGLLA
jgi:hypothetical protein